MAGGASTVGGATFGALALGVFGYIGTLSQLVYQIAQLLPGLVGVGLGNQPNGVAADMSASLGKLAGRLPGHLPERLRLASAAVAVSASGPVARRRRVYAAVAGRAVPQPGGRRNRPRRGLGTVGHRASPTPGSAWKGGTDGTVRDARASPSATAA